MSSETREQVKNITSRTIYGPSMPRGYWKKSGNIDWRSSTELLRDENDQNFFNRVLLIFIVLVVGIIIGYGIFRDSERGYEINLFTDVLGLLFTIGILEAFNERRSKRFEKAMIKRQFASSDKESVRYAHSVLQLRGWGFNKDRTLVGVNLEGANLRSLELRSINLAGANLDQVTLNDANLLDATLNNTSFMGTTLTETILSGADMEGAICCVAQFDGAELRYAILKDCDMTKCSFKEADLTGADLSNCVLCRADLSNATIAEEQLSKAYMLFGSTMPDGSIYDGRFNLVGDREYAKSYGIDADDIEKMQDWYIAHPPPPYYAVISTRAVSKREVAATPEYANKH